MESQSKDILPSDMSQKKKEVEKETPIIQVDVSSINGGRVSQSKN